MAAPWPVAALLLQVFATAPSEGVPLAFRLGVSRTHHAAPDTVFIVATATNTGATVFKTWGFFDFSGGYRASSETVDRWRAIRDSSLAAATGPHYRDVSPRLPTIFLISKLFTGEPLKSISLAPRESYSDTLRLQFWGFEYDQWPGYFDISGEFIMGAGPDTAGIVRLGKRDLRIAIPVP